MAKYVGGELGGLSRKEEQFLKKAKQQGYSLEQAQQFIMNKREETPTDFGGYMKKSFQEFTRPIRRTVAGATSALASPAKLVGLGIKGGEWIGEQANKLDRFMGMDVQTPGLVKGYGQDVIDTADIAQKKYQALYGKDVPGATGTELAKFGGEIALGTYKSPTLPGLSQATAGKTGLSAFGAGTKLAGQYAARELGETALIAGMSQGRLPTKEEMGLGAVIGAALPFIGPGFKLVGKQLKKIAPKLQLSGLLNPAKLDYVRNSLIEEGIEDIAKKTEPEEVARWMFARNIKGSKAEQIKQLFNIADVSKATVDDLLGQSKTLHKYPEASKIIENMYEELSRVPGLESQADDLVKMINTSDVYTLSELNKIKRKIDNMYNIYKQSGDVYSGLKAKGLNNLRSDLRKFIEDQAMKEGLGEGFDGNIIKYLNNQTSVATSLGEAISRKESSDFARELVNFMAGRSPGAIVGGTLGTQMGPFDNNTMEGKIGNILVMAFMGGLVGSTSVKSNVAKFINDIPGKQKSELFDWMMSRGNKTLSKKGQKAFDDIMNKLNNAGFLAQNRKQILGAGEDIATQGLRRGEVPKAGMFDEAIEAGKSGLRQVGKGIQERAGGRTTQAGLKAGQVDEVGDLRKAGLETQQPTGTPQMRLSGEPQDFNTSRIAQQTPETTGLGQFPTKTAQDILKDYQDNPQIAQEVNKLLGEIGLDTSGLPQIDKILTELTPDELRLLEKVVYSRKRTDDYYKAMVDIKEALKKKINTQGSFQKNVKQIGDRLGVKINYADDFIKKMPDDIRRLHDSGEEIFGFYHEGEVFLNPKFKGQMGLSLFHENTHAWYEIAKKVNPQIEDAWEKIMYDAIKKDDEVRALYKKIREDYATGDPKELAHEMMAYMLEDTYLRNLKKTNKNLYTRIINWLKEMGQTIQSKLGISKKSFMDITEDELLDMNMETFINKLYGDLSDKRVGLSKYKKGFSSKSIGNPLKLMGGKKAKNKPKTGWFEGVDGEMRFEIDDSKAKLKNNFIKDLDSFYKSKKKSKTWKLNDIIKHDELYEQYPELKKMNVSINFYKEAIKKSGGHYDFWDDEIVLNLGNRIPELSKDGQLLQGLNSDIERRILHEVQHKIQYTEGFNLGAGIRKIDGTKNLEDTDYWKTAGEVEARNVEKRKRFSKEKRLNTPFNLTQDVPSEKQLLSNNFIRNKKIKSLGKKFENLRANKSNQIEFVNQLKISDKNKWKIIDNYNILQEIDKRGYSDMYNNWLLNKIEKTPKLNKGLSSKK